MVKIAILALGRDGAQDAFARSQQQGLAPVLAERHEVLLYRAAGGNNPLSQRLAPSIFRINLWAPGGERLSGLIAGFLAAIHLRLVEKPDYAVVLNPWNAAFFGSKAANLGTSVVVDNLIRHRPGRFTPSGILGSLLANNAKSPRFHLTCHSDASAIAFEKRFGVRPKVVAPGIASLQAATKKPPALANDALLKAGFDLLIGSTDRPEGDAQAIRGHSRGARNLPLVYLPALDVRRVDSEELDDAIGKHGRIRVVTNSIASQLTPSLMRSARVVIVADQDLLGTRMGATALTSPAELLVLDSPANRELLSESSWIWAGEASLANLLTDLPWRRKSRAKLRVQGLQPLTDWRLVAQELLESFED